MKKNKRIFGNFLKIKSFLVLFLTITFFAGYSQTVETFTSSGSSSWVCPAGVTAVIVECWGAGGGGGNSNNATSNGGGGGGGGGYSKRCVAVTPGLTYYYSVGAGGSGGPASSTSSGTAGGNSWFNTSNVLPSSDASNNVLAYGGSFGVNAGAGGSGGSLGFGSIKYSGGSGGASASNSGGGGGSSAGTASNGTSGGIGYNGSSGTAAGGVAPSGGGNGGLGAGYTTTDNGDNGSSPGGGGGGSDDKTTAVGGSGAAGQVKLTYCANFPATISVNGSAAVPFTSYPNIGAAITAMNSCGISQATVLELTSNYFTSATGLLTDDNGTITLSNVEGQSVTNTITIRPASGVTGRSLSFSNTTAVFSFDGSDNWIIDGRPGGSGSSTDLIIENTSTSAGSAINFSNDATNNIIRYCTLKSNFGSSSLGIVNFSTTTGTTGNDNNTITYCILDGTAGATASPSTAGVAQNGIYSLGTSAKTNSGNIISYCEFKDIFIDGNGTYSSMIFLDGFNDTWTINNNSFYQTNSRSNSGSNICHMSVIDIDDGDGYTISSNYFGGTSASCSGTWTQTQTSTGRTEFYGINLAANVGTTTATSIQGNTFSGFSWTFYSDGIWSPIIVASGTSKVNIGTTTANIIGSTSSVSIAFDLNNTTAPSFEMFKIASISTVNIQNNTFAGISTSNTSSEGFKIKAIETSGTAGVFTIKKNTIGHSTGTIILGGSSTATGVCEFYGIDNTATGLTTIDSNTIQRITVYGTGASLIYGIRNDASTASSSSISYNTLSNLSLPSTGTAGSFNGIYNTSLASVTISNNIMSTITVANGLFSGINDAPSTTQTGTHTISSNTIGGTSSDDISVTSTKSGSSGSYWGSQVRDYAIAASGSTTTNISSNTIRNITVDASKSYYAFVGIYSVLGSGSGAIQNLTGNNISYISKKSTNGSETNLIGVFQKGNLTINLIKNKILNFKSETSSCLLIAFASQSATAAKLTNNFIVIDNNDYNVSSVYPDIPITAIFLVNDTPVEAYYNTIKIAGTNLTGGTSTAKILGYHSSYNSAGGTLTFYNNIFYNNRTGGGSRYITEYGGCTPVTTNLDYNYYYNSSSSTFGASGSTPTYYDGTTNATTGYNVTGRGKGGSNSICASSSPITINSDGSLETSALTTVGRGTDLSNSTTYPNCQDDIYYVARATSGGLGGYKGCYEGPCLIVTTNPSAGSICVGGTYSPSIQVQNASSVSTTFTYQMEFSTSSSGSFASVSNNTPSNSTYSNGYVTYTPVASLNNAPSHSSTVTGSIAAGSNYYYRYLITASTGCAIYTSSAQLTISSSNSISSQSTTTQTVCPGVSFSAISVTAAGANLSYQWYSNSSSSTSGGSSVSGATLASYTPVSTVAGTKYYYCVVSGTCGANVTSAVSGAMVVNSPMSTSAASGDYVWMGANTTWATASNWLSYDGSLFSVPVSSPTSSSRTIVSAANSCATAQPVLGANTSIGSLILESGATLGLSSYTLTVNGGFTNNGTFTAGTSTVAFTGSGTVGGSSSTTFNNLTINGSSISVVLGANITVQNTLTLTNGKLTTQGYTLLLGSTSANATVSGGSSTAYIVAYKDGATIGKVKQFVNSATSYSFPIGDASNYTPVTYTQTSGTLSNAYLEVFTEPVKVTGLNSAITTYLTRYWDVTSSGMTTPIYTISYTYADGDIVGTEASLLPIKKSQLTTPNTWYKPSQATSLTLGTTEGSGSVNASTNTLTWSGLSTFSLFGGAGDQGVPLPIGLLSFSGKKSGQDNELNWSTATEKNNDFFTVEKTIDGKVFDVVGNVNGSGTTLQKMEYSLIDYNVEKTINYYRLKQTDFDGKTSTTDLICIDNTEKNRGKVISYMTNILGQEINENFRGLVIIVYTDGTSEKVIR